MRLLVGLSLVYVSDLQSSLLFCRVNVVFPSSYEISKEFYLGFVSSSFHL